MSPVTASSPLTAWAGAGLHTSPRVCRIAGCSYRQLDWWCRSGLLVPVVPATGSGSSRLFDFAGVRHACIIARASALGLSMEPLHRLGVDEGIKFILHEVESIVEELIE